MHFSFHLDDKITEEQARRVANAVLAFGGVRNTTASELTLAVNIDTTNATAALNKLAAHPGAKWVEEDAVTANVSESPSEHKPPVPPAAKNHVEYPDRDVAEVPCGLMSANEIKELVSSPTVPVVPPAPPAAKDRSEALLANAPPVPSSGPDTGATEGRRFTAFDPKTGAALDNGSTLTKEELKKLVTEPAATLDKNGLPWDERIHSSSRNKNADGTWRMKRGVAASLVADVEQELRALLNGSFAGTQAPPVPIEVTTLGDSRPRYVDSGATPPPPPPVPPAAPGPTAYTYANVVNLIASKKLQPEVYVAIIGESLPDFAKTCGANPAAAGEAYEKLSNL